MRRELDGTPMTVHSLRTKLILSLVPLVVVVVGVTTWLAISKMTSAQKTASYAQVRELAAANANDFNASVRQQVDLSRGLAATLSAPQPQSTDEISAVVREYAERFPETAGVYVGYRPGLLRAKSFSPYWNRLGGKLALDPNDEVTPGSDWYDQTMTAGQEQILEPYEGTVILNGKKTHVLMSTYTSPITRGGKTIAVAANDGTTTSMAKRTAEIKTLDSGYAMLVTNLGTFVAAPDKALVGKKTLAQ